MGGTNGRSKGTPFKFPIVQFFGYVGDGGVFSEWSSSLKESYSRTKVGQKSYIQRFLSAYVCSYLECLQGNTCLDICR